MKSLTMAAAICFMIFSVGAFAQNSIGTLPADAPVTTTQTNSSTSLYSSNDLDTLHYRNARGVTTARLGYNDNVSQSTWTTFDSSQYTTGAFTYGNSLNLNVAYGITDLLAVNVTETESYSNTGNSDSSGNSGNFSSFAFSNPTVDLNYRVYGGLSSKLMATAYVEFTPAMTQFSGSYPGGTSYAVGGHLYSVVSDVEFQGTASYTYSNGAADSFEQWQAQQTGLISGTARYHFNSYCFLSGTLSDYLPTSRNIQNSFASWSYKQDSNWLYSAAFGAYLYRKSLIGQIGYTYSNIGSRSIFPAGTYADESTVQSSQTAFASLMTDFK